MSTERRTRSLSLMAGVVALLAACSSDGGGTSATSAPVTTAPSTSVPEVSASAACAAGGDVSLQQIEVTVDGTVRKAVVHIPTGATGTDPLPVVLSFHGAAEMAENRAMVDQFPTYGSRDGFITVYPQGLVGDAGAVSGVTGWDVAGVHVDEPAFVAALLDELGATVCIDESRVYAAGLSNGGAMALLLACELPERIAAVASIAGAPLELGCDGDAPPVPTIVFHGLDDAIVPYEGSVSPDGPFRPVLDLMAARAAINGCTGDPTIEAATPTVERRTWTGCAAPLVLYTLQQHGHAWPGHPLPVSQSDLAQYMDPTVLAFGGMTPDELAANMLLTNTSIDASLLSWEFFAATTA
jgi:polyhydroxybutyrate depolymerase